jgi:hypothetical protein
MRKLNPSFAPNRNYQFLRYARTHVATAGIVYLSRTDKVEEFSENA